MSSIDIYTPIPPTYLYIKQHSITGLKYFGKTTKKDPYKYNGSGKHWSNHIKKHGKEYVVTLWVSELYHDTSISDYALQFSIENNIVESNEWANLIPENGLDGGTPGVKHSAERKADISAALTGKKRPDISAALTSKPKTAEHKANMSKPKSAGFGAKVSAAKTGKKNSAEHNANISAALKDKPKSAEARANLSIAKKGKSGKKQSAETCAKRSAALTGKKRSIMVCPHCNTAGGPGVMQRWHFDNCKHKQDIVDFIGDSTCNTNTVSG